MLSWLLFLAVPPCGPTASLCLPQVAPPQAESETSKVDPTAQPAAPQQPQGEQQPATPVVSDPAALALFEKLSQAQVTEENLPPVEGFAVEMSIRLYLPEGGNDFDLGLYYKTEPMESVRLIVDDPNHGTRVEKGFDVDGFWLLDADKQLLSLDAHEFEQDRDAIDEAMVLCNDFLLLFDLKRLMRKASELQLQIAEDHTLITGKLKRGREKWGFELRVPKGEELPTRLSLQPPAKKLKPGAKSEPAEAAADETIPALPPRLHYEFGDWMSYEGRKLPTWIDEFHGEDLNRPLRVMEIGKFLWRESAKLRTARQPQGD
jgi:hypothetical protein